MISLLRRIKEWVFDYAVSVYYFRDARKQNRKYVVLGNPHFGIGNRLICLANTYAWYGKKNISLVWAMDSWVPMPFENLFKMTDAPGFKVTSCWRRRWSRFLQIPELVEGATRWWQLWVPPSLSEELPQGNLFCLYNDIPQWARKIYSGFFNQLQPADLVRQRIAECVIRDDVIRVQIRNSTDKSDAAGVASVGTFIKTLKAFPQSQRFYISCMNTDVYCEVEKELPGRVCQLPGKNYSSMVDAVADMWILGGGEKMICQRGSTFAEIAWWWRGCKSDVVAINREYFQAGRTE